MNVGDILRVQTTLANPPKIKIALYVGDGQFLWFNTEPRRRPAQILVFAGEVPGITRDCHLDCGDIKRIPAEELERAEHCGRASQAFLSRAAQEVALRAVTMAKRSRKSIVDALKKAYT